MGAIFIKYTYTFEVYPERVIFTRDGTTKYTEENLRQLKGESREEILENCFQEVASDIEFVLNNKSCELLELELEEITEIEYMKDKMKPENYARYKLWRNRQKGKRKGLS